MKQFFVLLLWQLLKINCKNYYNFFSNSMRSLHQKYRRSLEGEIHRRIGEVFSSSLIQSGLDDIDRLASFMQALKLH